MLIFSIGKGSTSYIESINQSGSPKKSICWYETQKIPKNLSIYLRNYQTVTDIFLLTNKAWKNNYDMQLFKFFHTENTSKQQKMVAFARNCSVRMTLRLFQSISVFINMVPMLLKQFRRLAQGHCWVMPTYSALIKQLTLKLHLWKSIFSSLLPAYWR